MKFGITGMAVVYLGQDLSDEYFDAVTDFGVAVDSNLFPLVYDHGYDEVVAKQRIGEGRFSREPTGLRFTGTVDVPTKFGGALKRLIADGELGFSTGALGHMCEKVKQSDGRTYLKSWHLGEASCTTNNCEPRTFVALKAVTIDDLRAKIAKGMEWVREYEKQEKRNQLFQAARMNHYRLKHIIGCGELEIECESVKAIYDQERKRIKREREVLQ